MLRSSYHPMPQCVDLVRIVNISKLKAYFYTYILTLHVNVFVRSLLYKNTVRATDCFWGAGGTYLAPLPSYLVWLVAWMYVK